MAYIAPALQQQLQDDLSAELPVIVTLKDDVQLPASLQGKGSFVLQDKIFAATLSSQQLKELAEHESIEAIEPDSPMGIF